MADFWHADTVNGTWTNMSFEAPPGSRAFTPVLPAEEGAIGTLIGGFDGANPLADGWKLVLP